MSTSKLMKSKYIQLLLLVSPAILAFFFNGVLKEFKLELVISLMMQVVFYLFLFPLLFSTIIKQISIKKIILFLSVTIYGISIFLSSLYYYLYSSSVSPSTIYFILQTNEDESFEFLENNINIETIGFTIFFIISFTLSLVAGKKLMIRCNKIKLKSNKVFFGGYVFFSITLVTIIVYNDLSKYSIPYLAVDSIIKHGKFTDDFENLNFKKKKGFFKNVVKNEIIDSETYVVIIGESTTKNKMELYGYEKNTNPKLGEIKDELFVFKDVISPNIGTILSLGKVLTTNNIENTSHVKDDKLASLLTGQGYKKKMNEKSSSIVQLFNQAGFKTFWLSNQRPMGIHENLVTEISKAADVRNFINIADVFEVTPYDYELLPSYSKALKDPAEKKIIFLHILGTHMHYKYRYPKEFEYFKDEDMTYLDEFLYQEKRNKKMRLEYDNAVRYNDFLVREVIEKVRKTNAVSYVLYFSDHGEELHPKNNNLIGRNLEERTSSMYEIPFVVWLSPEYKKKNNTSFNLSNKYMTDDLIHSISSLSNIEFENFEPSRSIFNKEFKFRKRAIIEGKDFNDYFPISK